MRTVGILTLSNSDNYGAVLQAYALRKFLCSNDYDVFFVPHAPTEKSKKRYLTAPIATIEKAYGLGFGALWNGYSRRKNRGETEAFRDIFSRFRAEFLGLTSTRFSYDELVRDPPLADAFVVGSDVVWGYDAYFNDAAYLLGFCGSGARRVSYAASFGKTRIERYQKPIFTAKLSQFDAISVREQSAAIILEKLGIMKAQVVCDPTFLIDDFEELDHDAETEDDQYICAYLLPQAPALFAASIKAAQAMSRRLGLPVRWIATDYVPAIPDTWTVVHPTPGEFLTTIKKATFCLTNSFHGIVFSLKFGTPFRCFPRDVKSGKKNNRMLNLLEQIGAREMFCNVVDSTDIQVLSSELCRQNLLAAGGYYPHIHASREFLLRSLD